MSDTTRSLFTPTRVAAISSTIAPVAVTELAKYMKRTLNELRSLPRDTIRDGMSEMKMDAPSRGDVDIWLNTLSDARSAKDSTELLAEEVRRQQDRAVFPWLALEEAATRQIQSFTREYNNDKKQAFENLKQAYIAKAKNGTLGTTENLVGQYCLFSPDPEYACFLLMTLLLRTPAQHRVHLHNWMIASELSRSEVESYGAAIATLNVPLYPVSSALTPQNQALLDAALSAHPKPHATSPAPGPVGGGILPLTQDPSTGAWGTDVTVVEQCVQNLQAQIAALQRQKAQYERQRPQQDRRNTQNERDRNLAWHPRTPRPDYGAKRSDRRPHGGQEPEDLFDIDDAFRHTQSPAAHATVPPAAVDNPNIPATTPSKRPPSGFQRVVR